MHNSKTGPNLAPVYWSMTNSYLCLGAFCFGATVPVLQAQLWPISALFLCCLASICLTLKLRRLIALVFFSAGLLSASFAFYQYAATVFPDRLERIDFQASGKIIGLPAEQDGNTKFVFRLEQSDHVELEALLGSTIQLSCYRCPLNLNAGDRWSFTLRVKRPYGYASWGAFDYEKFLFRHKRIAKGYVRLKGQNSLLAQSSWSIDKWRQSIGQKLLGKIKQQNRPVSDVGVNIVAALTIGDKSGFTQAQRQVFQDTGVSHLMAISGLHVGLVFLCVVTVFKWGLWPVARIFERWPRPQIVLFPAFVTAMLYSALAGFAVSTQRALVMLLVYVACRLLARQASLLKVLLIAATILLILDPFSVLDIGFWLSCGAVFIIAMASQAKQKLALVRLQPVLWLGMLPMSVAFFGQVSLLSPLVNLAIVPLFCLSLIPLTLCGLVLSFIGLDALSVWWLSWLAEIYTWIFHGLKWLSQLAFAKWFATPLVWWQFIVCGLIVFAEFLQSSIYRLSFRLAFLSLRVSLLLILAVSVFINTAKPLAEDELQIVLLDVGQGLAMVVETPNSVVVYDTGPKYSSGFTAADAVLLPYLRRRGIRFIDTLVISHADNDHIGGYQTVMDAFKVGQVLTSRIDEIPSAKLCQAGQFWSLGDTHFKVISPQAETPTGSNNLSCVIRIEHQGTKILLTGDIEKQVERYLLANHSAALKADILLVPHQGSKTSSTAEFIKTVSPNIAMVAAGYKNHYGHPHAGVVERYQSQGVDLYSTIDSGSILLKINANGWQIIEYRQAQRRFWHYQKLPKDAL